MGNPDYFIKSVIEWVIFVFNDEPVVREDKIQILFVHLLSQILLKIIRTEKEKEVISPEKEKEVMKSLIISKSEETEGFEHLQKEDLEEEKKFNFIANKIIAATQNPEILFILMEEIIKFIQQYPHNSDDVKRGQLGRIALKLGEIIFPKNEESQKLIESIFALSKGELDNIGNELLNLLSIDKNTIKIVKRLLEDFKQIVQAPQNYVAEKISYYNASFDQQNINNLDDIKEKLKNEEINSKDLFTAFDVDKSGKISLEEFKMLAKRLNMNLSEHRIKEIFTSVKGDESIYSQELNEKEFELALNYLQEKSILLTMEFLGITKEILFGILLWLTILLLILFAFIFAGIAAFTIAGTFGSIINSMFPIGKAL